MSWTRWRRSRWAGLTLVLGFSAAGGVVAGFVGATRAPTYTTTVRLELLPGVPGGIRAAQDHYVELLGSETDQPMPFDVPAAVRMEADRLEPWDPFFELRVSAPTPVVARAVVRDALAFVLADTAWPPEDPNDHAIVVRSPSTEDDVQPREDALVGGVVGLLMGTALAVAVKP